MSVREQEATRYSKATTLWDPAEALLLPVTYLQRARIDDEFFCFRCVDSAAKLATKALILEILTSMELEVIQGLIEGDLPERAREGLVDYFDNESRVADSISAVYTNFIVDKDGRPPTKTDVRDIIDTMELYIKKDATQYQQLAHRIDGLYGARQRWKYVEKDSYHAAHTKFISSMRERLNSGDEDSDDLDHEQWPLRGGISEVGFNVTPYGRINNHKNHTSSTCVMNLFEACAQHLFPGQYAVEGYAVARTINPIVISLSEIVISRLACSYIDHGCGFNYCRAGASDYGDQIACIPWATLQANAMELRLSSCGYRRGSRLIGSG